MALFYYQALQRNGRKTKGMIEADSARHARQLLRGKDLIPVHIEARLNASTGGMLPRRRHAHRRVAAADLALFTRQLATLVQAAMPLETCLQAVSEQSEKLHVKSLGMALRSRIQEGYTLSDSLREHPRIFDSLFCSMIAATGTAASYRCFAMMSPKSPLPRITTGPSGRKPWRFIISCI